MEEQILVELLLGISLPLAMIMMLLLTNMVRFEINTKSIIQEITMESKKNESILHLGSLTENECDFFRPFEPTKIRAFERLAQSNQTMRTGFGFFVSYSHLAWQESRGSDLQLFL